MLRSLLLLVVCSSCLCSARAQQASPADPLRPLDFLIGSWQAKTSGGSANAAGTGVYRFQRDLAGHILVRTSDTAKCQGPADFDCQHTDQLTIFADSNSPHGAGLYALYLDSEGHVIYYLVTTPDPNTAVFSSQGAPGAPQFRLTYHLAGAVMNGAFEVLPPGAKEFHAYLRWSGTKP